MSNATVGYRGNLSSTVNTNVGLSPSIWANCPLAEVKSGIVDGAWIDEDFDKGGLLTSQTTIASLIGTGWSAFGSSGATQQFNDASGITIAETTNDEATNIFQEQHPFQIARSKGPLWFEARIKHALTATTEMSMFVGLMDTTTTTAIVPLTATGAVADINCIGFHKPEANTTAFDASYKADSVTLVEANSDIGTIVADTYFKVGFRYNPDDQYRITWFVNGLKQTNKTTVPAAASGGTGAFPNDIALGVVLALAVGAAANDNSMTIDRVTCCQVAPTAIS